MDASLPREEQSGERRWFWTVAAPISALVLLPAFWGYARTGADARMGYFSGSSHSTADTCVYFAWMRSAADGHFFQLNLFHAPVPETTRFNLLFVALGNCARVTGLPIPFVYQVAHWALVLALLRAAWWLIEATLAGAFARRVAFLLLIFSSGLGWLAHAGLLPGAFLSPDLWQPEAVTFPCLLTAPLSLAGLLLMLSALGLLWKAERSGCWRAVAGAGACLLLLGNIHTYEVLTAACIWGGWLLARASAARQWSWLPCLRAAAAFGPAALPVGHLYGLMSSDPALVNRQFATTLSPPFWSYLWCYGIPLGLAVSALAAHYRAARRGAPSPLDLREGAALFLGVWLAANLAVVYLPVNFQRKLALGVHVPIALLAGAALAFSSLGLSRWKRIAWVGAITALTAVSNAVFFWACVGSLHSNERQNTVRPFLYAGERQALAWIEAHAPEDVPVQPLPWIGRGRDGSPYVFDSTAACMAPGLTGHPVHAGHWCESPDFFPNLSLWARFLLPDTDEAWRRELLRVTGVRYLVFSQKHAETPDPAGEDALLLPFRLHPPPFLRKVAAGSNSDADVYEVVEAP